MMNGKIQNIFLVALFCLSVEIEASDNYIENEYLLSLNTGLIRTQSQETALFGILRSVYNVEAIKTFHAGMLTILYVKGEYNDVMRAGKLPEVKYVTRNGHVYAAQACSEQPSPGTWGLDRIDQRGPLPYTDPQDPSATYIWGESLGTNSVVYVADTGVETTHPDFGGRAIWGYTVSGITEPETDLNGHGTHCAGISSSNSYGVAKNVTVVAVKVLSRFGSGSFSDVIEGFNWILQNHLDRQDDAGGALPRSVVDVSLGGSGPNAALEDFIQQMYEAGIVVVVSSGSSFDDACNYTPARAPNATTIASSDITDSSTSSNWGPCLDLFAPGVQVLSTWIGESTAVLSGTSMAASHVVGVVARYQGSLDPAPNAQQVNEWLVAQATQDALNLSPEHATSPNLLLYTDCLVK